VGYQACTAKGGDITVNIKDAKERQEHAEMRDIPRAYIQRFVKNATGNYAPGDIVWVVESKGHRKPCPLCNGSKKVDSTINGVEIKFECPKCRGYGDVTEYEKIVVKHKVREVRLKLCFTSDRANYWSTDSVFLDNSDWAVKVENIYPTEEAAQQALKGGADND
jgi:Zn-finger nucleic acid-binding protein